MGIEVEEELTADREVERAEAVERAGTAGRVRLPSTFFRDASLTLLALWLGAAVFFGAVVAPSAFSILRARAVPYANEAAGSIVTRTVAVVNLSGFFIALLLLACALVLRRNRERKAFPAEALPLALMAAATSVGQWVIAARMLSLRAQMGRPIDDVPATDPLRLSFDSLHGYSTKALGLAMLAALCALLLTARRGRRVGP